MKNLKKVLAIILSFSLMVGLWSTTATAAIVIDDPGQDDTINVTFYDGDTALPEISTSVAKGAVITLPTYSKAGKSFEGWKVNDEGTLYEAGESYTVNESVNFYGQFSQGSFVAVVMVQGGSTTNCTTMEEARVAALAAGETPVTIQLLNDVGITARLTLRDPDGTTDTLARNITIDLNGFTLSKEASMYGFFFINKQATLTVKGGTLDCKSYAGYMFGGNTGSTTIVESGTYKNFASLASSGAAEGLTISGGTWDAPPIDNLATGYEVIKNEDAVHFDVVAKTGDDIYSLSDGTNEATFASMDAFQVAIDYFAGKRTNIKLLKDVTTDARIGLVAGTETVPIEYNYDLNGHKLTYSGTSQGFVLVRAYDSLNINDTVDGGGVTVSGQSYYFTSNKNPGTLTVNAGTFAGATSFANANTQLVVNGGTWNIDPTAYVDATKYEVVQSGGTYTVKSLVAADASWIVDGVQGYGTYDEAMAAAIAGTNATVKLLQDCSKTAAVTSVPGGTSLTLNLNGHNLTNTYSTTTDKDRRFFLVLASGELTITDSSTGEPGSITGNASITTTACIAYANKNGTINITGGKFKEGAAQGTSSNNAFSRSSGAIYSITGGYFTDKSKTPTAYLAEGYEFASDSTYTGYTYIARLIPAKENVAEVTINGTTTKYESYDEAAAAAVATTDSATLKLLMDCEMTVKVVSVAAGTTVTLDLNGKKLTNTYTNTTLSSTYHRYFSVAGTLNIIDTAKGGSITGNNEYTGSGAVAYAAATGTIVVTADSAFYNGAAQSATSDNNRAFSRASGGIIEISDGWFTDISRPATGYLADGYSRVEVDDASKAAAPVTVSNTSKTIQYDGNGGSFSTAIADQVYSYRLGYTTLLNARDFSVALKFGYTCVGWSADKNAQPGDPSIIDTTGTNFATYAGDNVILYAIYQEVDPSMWVCVDTNNYSIGYADLASAFASSNDITLIKNVEGRSTLAPTSAARLNLNGYNIVGSTAAEAAGSALSIKGTVSIYNDDAGTITVGETDYKFGGQGIVEGYAQGTGGAIDVIGSNNGVLKIYGGTFKGDAPKNGSVITNSGAGKTYIYKGEFIETNPDTTSASSLYANTGYLFVLPVNQSDVKIQGTMAGASGCRLGITGGYFAEAQPAAVKIGTYTDAQGGNIIADPDKALKKLTGDDEYGYMVAPAAALVADENGNTYETFEAAVAALGTENDAAIILGDNVTLSSAVTYNNDITVNLNGFTLSGDMTVGDCAQLDIIGGANYSGSISSMGFVFLDGTLTTDGVVNQTQTAQKIEYAGGNISDVLGATFYARVALKPGDSVPTLSYQDPDLGLCTADPTVVGNGVVTFVVENIFVNFIAFDLSLQFMQGEEPVGEAFSYSLLEYYNESYTEGLDPKLDALLADTLIYSKQLVLMSEKGVDFTLPAWVDDAKTSDTPTSSDNIAKVTVSAVDSTNYKIMSGSVYVTEKSAIMYEVRATETYYKNVTLVVAGKTYVISYGTPNEEVKPTGVGTFRVIIDKISPTSYGDKYSAVLYVDGVAYHGVDYSINSYCSRMYTKTDVVGTTTIGAVALSLYNFGKAAVAYTAK